MTQRSLDDARRAALLRELSTLRSDGDDAVADDPRWFLPLEAHRHALRMEALVVRGGRGAGKSALFGFLRQVQRHPELAVHASVGADIAWCDGFDNTQDHPSLEVVGEFDRNAVDDDERRFFWFAWLCVRLAVASGTALPPAVQRALCGSAAPAALAPAVTRDPQRLAATGRAHLVELSGWLDALERGRTQPIVVTYDRLDRIGSSSATRQHMATTLLAMWLSLADRYRRVRPKIFLREDLFQASLSKFPDASKLMGRSVVLDWRVEDLYRVLIKHMANVSDGLKDWIEASARGIPLSPGGRLGWLPPPTLPPEGPASQKHFVDHLAGEWMGSGPKKGRTVHWIPNRLQDAHARAVPRSILGLVRNAAQLALDRGPKGQYLRLLHPEELAGALEATSKARCAELEEEFPVVNRLESLRGQIVMLPRRRAVAALAQVPRAGDDGHGDDGERVLQTLIDLGVMSERQDGRIDIPDIYRYHFGILRKGGVKRPQ